jgi:hypothetical protein
MTRFSVFRVAAAVSVLVLHGASARAEGPAGPTDDVAVKAALLRSLVANDLRAPEAAAAASTAPTVATRAGTVEPMRQNRLADIGSAPGTTASTNAGAARDVAVATSAAATVERPTAGIRVLRRMNVERALAAAGPAIQVCADRGGVRTPSTPTFKLSVLPTGEVERSMPVATTGVARDTVRSVAAALMTAKFTGPGGTGASLAVPLTLTPGKAGTTSASPPSSPLSAPPSSPAAASPPAVP